MAARLAEGDSAYGSPRPAIGCAPGGVRRRIRLAAAPRRRAPHAVRAHRGPTSPRTARRPAWLAAAPPRHGSGPAPPLMLRWSLEEEREKREEDKGEMRTRERSRER